MNIFNFDREILISIIAIIMLTLFCLDVIVILMAIKLRKGDDKDSPIQSLIRVSSIFIGMISIVISLVYWCILK